MAVELDVGALEEFNYWRVKSSLCEVSDHVLETCFGVDSLLGMAKSNRSLRLFPKVSVRDGSSRESLRS